MKISLKEMLQSLSYETLTFMSDSNHANGAITGDQIPKVIGRINSVLRRLNVKFTLSEKYLYVNVSQNRRDYSLLAPATWILDPNNEFKSDVGRILGIEDPSGRMHDLNDLAKHDTILLLEEGKSFALDASLPNGVYKVIYKVATPVFAIDGSDQEQEIEIPEALLNALYVGVAAITYEGIGGSENIALATAKWAQYEKECGEAKINSAVIAEQFEDRNNFRDRGFR